MTAPILYLRPFRDRVATLEHLRKLSRVTRKHGTMRVLDSVERNVELGRIDGLSVLETTDAEWVEQVTGAIRQSRAIIYHLVPKEAVLEGRLLDAIIAHPGPGAPAGQLSHLGTGAGLLHELVLCRDHGDLRKVIVISPDDYLPRIERIIDRRPGALMGHEASLKLLREVPHVIPYRLFGDFLFRVRLRRALADVLGAGPA